MARTKQHRATPLAREARSIAKTALENRDEIPVKEGCADYSSSIVTRKMVAH